MNRKVDVLIKDGLIVDGTGSEPYEADVGISADKIDFISKKSEVMANGVIDAKDMIVSPGFIDTHAHSEFTLLADPRAEGKISQGITTEINGNCGLSAAPLYGDALKQREDDLRELGITERWSTFKEYFDILKKKGCSLNFISLTGHGNLRACITGYEDRKLADNEIKKMQMLLRETIRDGSIGISTGLIYPPGVYSDTEELIHLLQPSAFGLQPSEFIYTSHMRSEGDGLVEAVNEIIRIGKEAGIKVHVSHIKTSGEKNWKKIDDVITLIGKAREDRVEITCDRYPYTAASTDLDTVLPSWAYEGGAETELQRLNAPEIQEKIKREILYEHPDTGYWEKIRISSIFSGKNRWMIGKSMACIAHHKNSEPVDMLFRILIEEKLRIGAIFYSMSEDNLKRFLLLPYCMIGTDSSARSADGPTHKGKPHPRGFGSFPRFLGLYIRDEGLMSLSQAVHRITMLPARTFGILNRGVIKKGAFADIVIFDYKKIIDAATFDVPFLKSEGIGYVLVNGVPVIHDGKPTGNKTGRILRHGRG